MGPREFPNDYDSILWPEKTTDEDEMSVRQGTHPAQGEGGGVSGSLCSNHKCRKNGSIDRQSHYVDIEMRIRSRKL